MRYRPFARAGMAVSSLSLTLDGGDEAREADDWRDLLHAAFEHGVNAFEIVDPSPALLAGFADGVSAIPRHLLFIALRVRHAEGPDQIVQAVEDALGEAHLNRLDLLNIEVAEDTPPGVPVALKMLKERRRADWLGAVGEHALLEPHVTVGGFDALATSFNLLSDWRERHLVRAAMAKQIAVVGLSPFPDLAADLADEAFKPTKGGWFSKPAPLAGAGTYAFLHQTPGWDAEQICLGYALTEPSLATVQVSVEGPDHLADLASVVDRDLPSATAAQIEMARFFTERAAGTEPRQTLRSA